MNTFIALFRGINVGGNNILPMSELVEVLKSLKLDNVKTYIQSGNVVFQSKNTNTSELSKEISSTINKSHGFKPKTFLLDVKELEKAIAQNPFPEGEKEPKALHLFFLTSVPENPDLEALNSLKKENEQFKLIQKIFYLHAPDGIGQSKLAMKVEKALGVAATARNWRSVNKIMSMAIELI